MADIITRASSPSQRGGSPSTSRKFSVIPPSNKGFSILSKSLGWQEGEGLGRRSKRRHTEWPAVAYSEVVGPVLSARSTTEIQGAEQDGQDGAEESEGEDESSIEEEDNIPAELQDIQQDSNNSRLMPIAGHSKGQHTTPPQVNPPASIDEASRITPISVAFKHDRLGVGASKKRTILTSNTLARFASSAEQRNLSAGAIRHSGTKARRRERRAKFGRGRNSYARLEKQQVKDRERMLEYMNT